MASNHITARGIPIDMDRLRIANEHEIAVGNMKVNARGDQLGPGGKIIKTRAQIMQEKNKLNHSPIADEFEVKESLDHVEEPVVIPDPVINISSKAEDTPIIESSSTATSHEYVKPRGSFADSVAKETEIKQELLDPSLVIEKKTDGIQRI